MHVSSGDVMDLFSAACPLCGSAEVRAHSRYETQAHGPRTIYRCRECDIYYSETFATPIAGLTTPLSRIITVLTARSEGMGLNATARTFKVSKKSVMDWEQRLGELKPTLMLYSLLHEFIHQEIEGDELYTKVNQNIAPSASEGWTIVLMERGSRFLWELHCGRKDQQLFERALRCLAQVIKQTGSLSLLTDGERRYGNLLFEICHDVIRSGKPGRPAKRLPKGVRVRLKNKGSKKRTGRRRKKYQAPVAEHPETVHQIADEQIHANHVEAFNASLRRRNAAFRRKTNTYAKSRSALQRTLDVYWLVHNFVRVHFTTKAVPAVKLGILETGLSWVQLFSIRYAV
ncbi:MAG: IS1 family transposase [Phormidesmis sp.]